MSLQNVANIKERYISLCIPLKRHSTLYLMSLSETGLLMTNIKVMQLAKVCVTIFRNGERRWISFNNSAHNSTKLRLAKNAGLTNTIGIHFFADLALL